MWDKYIKAAKWEGKGRREVLRMPNRQVIGQVELTGEYEYWPWRGYAITGGSWTDQGTFKTRSAAKRAVRKAVYLP